MNAKSEASHLNTPEPTTADPKPQWPSIREQQEYWKLHDHGGNVIEDRKSANEEQYGD